MGEQALYLHLVEGDVHLLHIQLHLNLGDAQDLASLGVDHDAGRG